MKISILADSCYSRGSGKGILDTAADERIHRGSHLFPYWVRKDPPTPPYSPTCWLCNFLSILSVSNWFSSLQRTEFMFVYNFPVQFCQNHMNNLKYALCVCCGPYKLSIVQVDIPIKRINTISHSHSKSTFFKRI